jgi:pristinamycin I synthase 3 and 4
MLHGGRAAGETGSTQRQMSADRLPPTALATPAPALEEPHYQTLERWWCELLGVGEIGPDDNFFRLGGNSLHVVRLATRLHDELSIDLPLAAVFSAATLNELMEAIRTSARSAPVADRHRQPAQGAVPATPSQEARLLRWRAARGTAPAHAVHFHPVVSACRIRGPLDGQRLHAALDAVIRRHDALRAFVRWHGERPELDFAATQPVPLAQFDLEDASLERVQREIIAAASQPFDLSRGPLVRALLFRAREEHVLAIVIDHLVCDGWSLAVVLSDLWRAYELALRSERVDLPPPRRQFGDYALWLASWMRGAEAAAMRAFWHRRLGETAIPELTLGGSSGPGRGPEPASVSFDVPPALRALVVRRVQTGEATLFMLMLAAFAAVASARGAGVEIAVVAPAAGREHQELDETVGWIANAFVVKLSVAGDPMLSEVLRRAKEATLQAYANSRYPFYALLRELTPNAFARPITRPYMYLDASGFAPPVSAPGLEIEPLPVTVGTHHHALALWALEDGVQLRLTFAFDAAFLAPPAIDELGIQLQTALRLIASDEPARLSALQRRLNSAERGAGR